MYFEIKRQLNNKSALIYIGLVITLIIGAYVLITIENFSDVKNYMRLSMYFNIITQFGFIVFSPIIGYIFTKDINEKNLTFFKIKNISSFKLFLIKFATLTIWALIATIICLVIAKITYFNLVTFNQVLNLGYLIFTCLMQYVIIIGLISQITIKVVWTFLASVAYWVISLLLVIGTKIEFFAYFDQNLHLDERLMDAIKNNTLLPNFDFINIFIYIIVTFIITLICVKVLDKYLIKNSVKG